MSLKGIRSKAKLQGEKTNQTNSPQLYRLNYHSRSCVAFSLEEAKENRERYEIKCIQFSVTVSVPS